MIDTAFHKRLKGINTELTLLEKKLLTRAILLDKQLQTQLTDESDEMIDYELEATIECYYGPDEPFTLREFLKGVSLTKNKLLWGLGDNENHNEFEHRENHPMKDDQHCWLFHCLYNQQDMSWEDIANIKCFLIDILPRHQYQILIDTTDSSNLPIKNHLVYSANYRISIDEIVRQLFPDFFDTYPLDLMKFEKISSNLSSSVDYQLFQPMDDDELSLFHTKQYLQSIREDISAIESVVAFSIPSFISTETINENLVDAARSMCAGTVYAAKLALTAGWAINIGGGFHHARNDSGGGFCFFNDYAIATHHLQQTNPDIKILYVDLDAHMGDGVLTFAKETHNFYILDIFNTFTKLDYGYIINTDPEKRFTLIGIQSYTTDKTYLTLLKEYLPRMLNNIKPDIIYYNGGSDILVGDQLGQLAITPEGMIERDLFVFGEAKKREIPIMMCLSGGYGKENYRHVTKSLEEIIKLMEE